jgi:hypothetical protein
MKIGIVGYSSSNFNLSKAQYLIELGIDYMAYYIKGRTLRNNISVVSSLTNLGIPKLAYEYATAKGYQTVGIACEKAKDYDCYPVDKAIIEGKNWGDESSLFINEIDCLVRVGGGEQSLNEALLFRSLKPEAEILEFNLLGSKID